MSNPNDPKRLCAICTKDMPVHRKADACKKCLKKLQDQVAKLPEPKRKKICGVCKQSLVKGSADGCDACIKALEKEGYRLSDSVNHTINNIIYGRMPIRAAIERLAG